MNITIIGTGYVGLVTGTCFAAMGNNVTCLDIDRDKIETLKKGKLPIYEPGLAELVSENYNEGRLDFSTNTKEAVSDSDFHFIAVGTPPGENGAADLTHVLAAASELGKTIQQPYNIIVNKSTVPVGSADKVRQVLQSELDKRNSNIKFEVVSNPEFLKEGDAVNDFMHPDRIIIGCEDAKAKAMMRKLYEPFTRNHDRILVMGTRDAEMTKYAANAMLATKISFINEIAALCEKLNVDVENVRVGIGSDERIGYHFIYPGCGYGGSCFPKDVQALQRMAQEVELEPLVLNAVEERNARQKRRLYEKIISYYGNDLDGKVLALWGLAFKPGTDDMREAPSLVLIRELIKSGAKIRAYDPVANLTAIAEMQNEWLDNEDVTFFDHQYDALEDADALVIVTEWKSFRNPDFYKIPRLLKRPVIFDGRNQYNPVQMKDLGFVYYGIGRGEQGI